MAVRLRDGVVRRATRYGEVLLDLRSGRYWTLNPSGVLMSEELFAGTNPEQLADVLVESFGIEVDVARRDAAAFVEQLLATGLVRETP